MGTLACRLSGQGLGMGVVPAVAGCASVPRSGMQTLEIGVVTPSGVPVAAARCALNNAPGEWTAAAPGKVTLSTDASPLLVRCEAAEARGEVSVRAEAQSGRWGRSLVGGGIGLAVGRLPGNSAEAKEENGFCCSHLGAMVGAVLSTVAGASLGSGTADPLYVYLSTLRVVVTPSGLPRRHRVRHDPSTSTMCCWLV